MEKSVIINLTFDEAKELYKKCIRKYQSRNKR